MDTGVYGRMVVGGLLQEKGGAGSQGVGMNCMQTSADGALCSGSRGGQGTLRQGAAGMNAKPTVGADWGARGAGVQPQGVPYMAASGGLVCDRSGCQGLTLLEGSVLYDPHRALWRRVLGEWLLPVLVVMVGVACSVAGLWVSVRDAMS